MREIWRDIDGFLGYQVSNLGRVRTFWKKKHYPTGYGTYRYFSNDPQVMRLSDDGNGYMKVMLYSHKDGRRYCKKVHRLVAEAFIPNDDPSLNTVDHIKSGPEGKLNNSVKNLRWISRAENIRKAYRDGMCDARILSQNKPIIVYDTWSGLEKYYHSIKDAIEDLRLNASTVYHAIDFKNLVAKRYYFEYAGREERLLYEREDDQFIPWI